MGPVSHALYHKIRYSRFGRSPIEAGIEPTRLLAHNQPLLLLHRALPALSLLRQIRVTRPLTTVTPNHELTSGLDNQLSLRVRLAHAVDT